MNKTVGNNSKTKLIEKIDQLQNTLDLEIQALKKTIYQDAVKNEKVIDGEIKDIVAKKKVYHEDQLFSYQIWIGELGKIIIDLINELGYYKKTHLFQDNKIVDLESKLSDQADNIKNLNEKLSWLLLLRKEFNQLYSQFYLIKESRNSLKRIKYVRLRNKIKEVFFKKRVLGGLIPKTYLLIKAILSFKFGVYIRNNRLLKKYEWEVEFIRNSETFDYHYYLSKYTDIKPLETDPVWHYVTHGWKEGRNPNQIFDSAWYLHVYEDIRNAGINPFLHYLQKGIIEKRRPNPFLNVDELNVYLHGDNYIESFTKYLSGLSNPKENNLGQPELQIVSSDHIKQYKLRQIVYVSGLYHNTSHQFRVTDQINILRELNYNVDFIELDYIEANEHLLVFAEIVVLFRVAWDEKLERVISKCRKAGVVVVYDTDDFVFDPGIANEANVDGIRFLPEKEKKLYYEGVLRYQKAAANCDVGIFTTPRLANAYRQLYDKESFIIKNGFSDYFFDTSVEALRENRKSDNIIIGYASGSLTHQKDFRIASKAIARILQKHSSVRLKIVGLLDINEFPELLECKEQIDVVPAASHSKLPYELATFDINLAPLEIDNPFCEAKSDLKYFEAALVRVPTVASATEPYRMAIRNGKTGYLVSKEEEWFKYLDLLVSNRSYRSSMGDNAYKDAVERYSCKGKKKEVQETFERIYEIRRKLWQDNDFNHTITFVLPEMARGSGGHAKIISIAKWLTKFEHSVTLNFIGNHTDYPDPQTIEREFDLNTVAIRALYTETVAHDSNIIFATFWKTVYYIENSKNFFGKRLHLLQDYEPYFYSMGTDYLLAINAMKKNFRKISYGPWIKDIIYNKHGIESETMSFYYNKEVYFDDKTPRKDNVIVFFARPEMPRRCFDLGWKALKIYRERYGNNTEIIIFGSYAVEHINMGFQHTNLNVKPPVELAALYRSSTIGIAFSPTNPSMVPFEMMACGLPVLDLDIEGNEINYGGKGNVFLVNPDENEIADTIHKVLNDQLLREKVAENGKDFIQKLPEEMDAIYELEKKLINNV